MTTPSHYLLCWGPEPNGDGEGRGFVSAFELEREAREAFRRLRSGQPRRAAWAEVAALDERGRLNVLAWFGRPSPPLTADVVSWSTPHIPPTSVRRRGPRWVPWR